MRKMLKSLIIPIMLLTSISAQAADLKVKHYPRSTTNSGNLYTDVTFQAIDHYNQPAINEIVEIAASQDLGASPKKFTSYAAAEAYLEGILVPTLLANINSANGDSYYTSYTVKPVDTAIIDYAQPIDADLTAIANIAGGVSVDMLGLLAQDTVDDAISAMALVANDITDATAVGKSVMTAANAAAARSAIGAGSSNFDGAYSSLTGIPSTFTPSAHNHAASDITSGTKTSSFISDFVEAAQDAIAAALSSEFTYNDGANTITLRAKSFTNNANRSSNVTTGTGATGFQISSSRDALVNYSVTVTTAVQIGLATNVDGYVVLEIAATNSATAGDWIEIARTPQAQNIGLALALSSTQKGGGNLTGMVPAGYYAKIRTVNVAGTPTYTYNSGQEVLF